MADRDLKIRHTTEGAAQAKADIEGVAQAEEKLTQQVDADSAATDDLNVKKENLTNILNRIHPSLGSLADTFANAGELAGELGGKNIELGKTFDAVREGVMKNIGAIKLLGAGGAAIGAVMFLISTVRKLRQEMEEVLEAQKKIEEQNRRMIDKSRSVRQMLVEAVEAGEIAPPSEKEVARIEKETRQGEVAGLSTPVAFEIAMNKRAALSEEAMRFISGDRGVEAQRDRAGQEALKRKTLGTAELDLIKQQTQFSDEEIQQALADLKRLQEGGYVEDRWWRTFKKVLDPTTPTFEAGPRIELRENNARLVAQALGILKEVEGRIGQLRGSDEARPPAPPGTTPPRQSDQDRQTANDLHEAADALKESADLVREQNQEAHRTSEELRRSVEAQGQASDRTAAKMSRNGTTPRLESVAGGEG